MARRNVESSNRGGATASSRRRFVASAALGAGAVLTGCANKEQLVKPPPTLADDLNADSTAKIIAAIVNWDSANLSLWGNSTEHEAWLVKLFSDDDLVVDAGLMDPKVYITDATEKDKVKKILKSMKRGAGGLGHAVYKRVQAKTKCSPCGEGPPPPPENY